MTELIGAISRLRGWRRAGENHANSGGSILQLDRQVDIALDEIDWRQDPENASEEEIQRPAKDRLEWAMEGMANHFKDDIMGRDLEVICHYLAA
jgi:hypothetical protein